jgi:CBS-domain-containing membrane protein
MKTRQVKELMVPISEYATIHASANMVEAIQALESEKRRYKEGPYRHQSLVVIDENRHVVGRLSQVDIMRAMEPRYRQIGAGDDRWIGRSVLSKKVLATLRESFELWEQPMEELCKAVSDEKVKDYMQKPSEGEIVSETDTFNIAVHRIIMGRHHSLLVTQGKVIVGILRSTDLFNSLYDMMTTCKEFNL